MAQINLLPWREELRRQKTKEFTALAGLIAIAAILVVAAGRFHAGTMVDYQQARNQYLQSEIDILKTKLEKIKDLEKTKENLLARMNIIQELQRSRPEIVHLFEELVLTVPEGLWLDSIKQVGNQLTLTGKAESSARVSAYMRNLGNSDWLKEPVLEVIQAEKDDRIATFTLRLSQESQIAKEEGD